MPTGSILDLLLRDLDAGRKVAAAAEVFRRTPGLECVWTGGRLVQRFDIDHGIAFSLWRNNDLWNLFPPSVERDLIRERLTTSQT
jgi:hypothetical protein